MLDTQGAPELAPGFGNDKRKCPECIQECWRLALAGFFGGCQHPHPPGSGGGKSADLAMAPMGSVTTASGAGTGEGMTCDRLGSESHPSLCVHGDRSRIPTDTKIADAPVP